MLAQIFVGPINVFECTGMLVNELARTGPFPTQFIAYTLTDPWLNPEAAVTSTVVEVLDPEMDNPAPVTLQKYPVAFAIGGMENDNV